MCRFNVILLEDVVSPFSSGCRNRDNLFCGLGLIPHFRDSFWVLLLLLLPILCRAASSAALSHIGGFRVGDGVHGSYTFQCGLVGSFTSPGIDTR